MAERQLDRIENQNRVFDSESLSDDTSEEESKSSSNVRVDSNSFDDSGSGAVNLSGGGGAIKSSTNNKSRRVSTDGGLNMGANTTAKSVDSTGYESSNFKAL